MATNPKVGCGDGAQTSPYDAVWHDPTAYDPLTHGPSYMPDRSRLSSGKRAAVRRVVASRVNTRMVKEAMGAAPLGSLLAVLQAASLIHKTHHWQTRGPQYYADHLLFDRLYEESQTFIDQVAERAVGLGTVDLVNATRQASQVAQLVGLLYKGPHPEAMVQSSLNTESFVIAAIDRALKELESSGSLSNGTDNLLQGAADLHETFVYLLQQRATSTPGYDYAR